MAVETAKRTIATRFEANDSRFAYGVSPGLTSMCGGSRGNDGVASAVGRIHGREENDVCPGAKWEVLVRTDGYNQDSERVPSMTSEFAGERSRLVGAPYHLLSSATPASGERRRVGPAPAATVVCD